MQGAIDRVDRAAAAAAADLKRELLAALTSFVQEASEMARRAAFEQLTQGIAPSAPRRKRPTAAPVSPSSPPPAPSPAASSSSSATPEPDSDTPLALA